MYDSIRSGSIWPQFSSTTAIWRAKKGRSGSPRRAATSPPFRPATIEAASVGAHLLVERAARDRPGPGGPRSRAACSRPRRPGPARPARPARRPSSSPSDVACDPDERQPAAVQTADPDGLPGRQLLLGDRLEVSEVHRPAILSCVPAASSGAWLPADLAVEDHDRGQAAGAQAPGGHRARPGRRPSSCPVRPRHRRSTVASRVVGPLDVAGGARADDAGVLTLGGEGEEVVERRDAVDPAGRQLEPVGDVVAGCRPGGSRTAPGRCAAPRSARRAGTGAASCSRRAS